MEYTSDHPTPKPVLIPVLPRFDGDGKPTMDTSALDDEPKPKRCEECVVAFEDWNCGESYLLESVEGTMEGEENEERGYKTVIRFRYCPRCGSKIPWPDAEGEWV